MAQQQSPLAFIRARMDACRQALEASLESAIEQGLVSADDSAMTFYREAVYSLDESLQAATTAVTRLAVAENALVAFKAAVNSSLPPNASPASVSGMCMLHTRYTVLQQK